MRHTPISGILAKILIKLNSKQIRKNIRKKKKNNKLKYFQIVVYFRMRSN